ncbi:SRPBCC family protein [Mycobacterium sp. smrl_JER01]|uniref:SRPBCC family protein n=1 Tax=Mycobacterium sp. smrl_JER01 TaxID=3402633 RepID=UPI003AC46263
MQLVNEFTVDASLDATWAVLTDIPTVVECVPGAELIRHEGADYHAHVVVKVGPIAMTLAGKATLVSKDDTAREMVVHGAASDRKGNGSTAATVRLTAHDDFGRSTVVVRTDLELSGRIAQFGKGAIVPVSNRIIGQFVDRLDAVIAGEVPQATSPSPQITAPAQPTASAPEWMTLVANGFAGLALGLAMGHWLRRLTALPRR